MSENRKFALAKAVELLAPATAETGVSSALAVVFAKDFLQFIEAEQETELVAKLRAEATDALAQASSFKMERDALRHSLKAMVGE